MRWLLLLLLPSCHLGADVDPPKCSEDSHPELGRCVANETAKLVVKIEACVATPELLVVHSGEFFQFDNADAVRHEVRGPDDEVWVDVPPAARSAFASIEKVGTWSYRITDCGKGGSVKVE